MYNNNSKSLQLLPFYECTDFELIELFQSCRHKLITLIKEKGISNVIDNSVSSVGSLSHKIKKM